MMALSPHSRVLGIDIGATHSRARLVAGSEVVAEATAASASVAAQGLTPALAALGELLAQLPLDEARPLDAICVGAAGITRQHAADLIQERLTRFTEDGRVFIVSDVSLVLPAAGLDEGVGVICGTGTVALGRLGQRAARAGGWGYLLADEGSGYWLVRRAVRAVLERRDRGRPLGPLSTELLLATTMPSLEQLAAQFYEDPRPGRWAYYAPVVLGSADPAAATIIDEAASALHLLVEAVLERLGHPSGLPIVLAGGLTANERFRSAVTSELRRVSPSSQVSVLGQPPVAGAVRLAQMASAGQVPGSTWQLD
jgi:N-acetylglucosamine kinase-like BadF-type ATPase